MIHIEIDEQFNQKIWTIIERAVSVAIDYVADGKSWINTWDCSVVVTDDDAIQGYNAMYRGYDKPTDVLSFESHEIDPESGALNLGDIIISYPQTKKQALQGNHTIEKELELLCVHGALHLLGFDHLEPEEKKEMWQIQAEVLAILENAVRPV